MSEINYQALREAAERAIPAMERLLMLPADDDLLSEQELKDYGVDIDALNAFKFLTGPETVLALLDERERNLQYIKSRDQENEDIALTVGKLRVELEAAEKRIAELEAEPVSQTYKSQHTQFEQVADLYEMQFDDGRTCAFHTDAQKAAQWLQACDGNRVQEYVKLERLRNALSGNSPVTPDGWISCSERMPNDKQYVWCWGKSYGWTECDTFEGYYDWSRNKWWAVTDDVEEPASKVTHWMPLPEPPQEVK